MGTPQSSRDVLSPVARRKGGFELQSLNPYRDPQGAWVEALVDDRLTPVPDQVSFRIDFPRWLASQSARNQQIADRLAQGDSTSEVARDFRISPARVSQLRRELAESWYAFISAALESDTAEQQTLEDLLN